MTPEETTDLVTRYIERVWNRCDVDALDELTTGDFTYRIAQQAALDRDGMRRFLQATHAAFPDWRVQLVQTIAEAGSVAVQWEGLATHRGAFHGIAPTGRRISVAGINIYTVRNGRIAAEVEQMDSLGMLQQLGALPR